MRNVLALAFLLSLTWAPFAVAEDKATSLSDARAAVEANLRTPEGKKCDEEMGQNSCKSTSPPSGSASKVRGMIYGVSGSC